MNERIKELRKQAINFCLDKGSQGNLSEEVSEKFAELIVKECVDICDQVQWQYGQYTFTATTVKNRVREHFGVEP